MYKKLYRNQDFASFTKNEVFNIDNKHDNIIKQRLLNNLINKTNIINIPTFYKFDERSVKCRDILTFNEKLTNKKVSYEIKNFYDLGKCLNLRSIIFAKSRLVYYI